MVRLGYDVKVGQLYSTKIDFVGTKGDEVVYVQAAYLISEESTFNRGFGNLMPHQGQLSKIFRLHDAQHGFLPMGGYHPHSFCRFPEEGLC